MAPPKRTLISPLLRDNDRLQKCAQFDGSNVCPGEPASAHVGLIQEALRQVAGAAITETGYGSQTTRAVVDFKTSRDLFTRGTRTIDPIVGTGTIAALDIALVKADPANNDVGPGEDQAGVSVDVVVKFAGTLGTPKPLGENDIFPRSLVTAYQTKNNGLRRLLLAGHSTISIGADGKLVRDKVMKQIDDGLGTDAIGLIFLHGSSSGGRNVLDFAPELKSKNRSVEYLAAVDAAFSPNLTKSRPTSFFGEPTNVPAFPGFGAQARKMQSFFQTAGNHSKFSVRQNQTVFTSAMDSEEIHGDIAGFLTRDLTASVKGKNAQLSGKPHDDQCHIDLSGVAKIIVNNEIAAILNKL